MTFISLAAQIRTLFSLPVRLGQASPPIPRPTELGAAALMVARQELGRGELGTNNGGFDVVRYRRGVDDNSAWCAAFMSFCIEEGAASLKRPCPVKRSHGAKRLIARVLDADGTRIMLPEVGSLALWHRGVEGAATGHVGIVSRVEMGSWWSVEGNKGTFPSRVREYQHELGEPNFLGFVRLPG